jgi:hypothetical protein
MGFFRSVDKFFHDYDPMNSKLHDQFGWGKGVLKTVDPQTKVIKPDYEALYQSGDLQKGNVPDTQYINYKKGGKVKKSGSTIRGHGIESKGKTKGRFVR